jgi:hypothetical protein
VRAGTGADFSDVSSPGDDTWFAGSGVDHVTDFDGQDVILGGAGGDSCLATADGSGGDEIVGGPGIDTGDADPADDVRGVENEVLCFAD